MASKIKFHHHCHEPMIATLSNPSPGAGIHRQLVTAVSTIDHPNRYQSPAPPPTMANPSFLSLTGFPQGSSDPKARVFFSHFPPQKVHDANAPP